MIGSIILTIIVGFVVSILLEFFISIIIVGEREAVLVERLGIFNRTLKSGLNWIDPILEKFKVVKWQAKTEHGYLTLDTSRIPINQDIGFDPAEFQVYSSDNLQIFINLNSYFRIEDPMKAVYEVRDPFYALQQCMDTELRNVATEMTFSQLNSGRNKLSKEMLPRLNQDFEKWGLRITRLDIQSIRCSSSIMKATENSIAENKKVENELINEKMLRERKLEAISTKRTIQEQKMILEQERVTKSIEIETLELIGKAEAYRQEQNIRGKADANYLKTLMTDGGVSENYLVQVLQKLNWENISKSTNKTFFIPFASKLRLDMTGGGIEQSTENN